MARDYAQGKRTAGSGGLQSLFLKKWAFTSEFPQGDAGPRREEKAREVISTIASMDRSPQRREEAIEEGYGSEKRWRQYERSEASMPSRPTTRNSMQHDERGVAM